MQFVANFEKTDILLLFMDISRVETFVKVTIST